ncbi:acyl-CoA dehydrogenase, partial [Saccharopolyspora shandongensis]
ERASRRIARQTFYGMTRWRAGLQHRQLFLGRIVDIGAELYAMSASCVYARTDDRDETAVELADTFCRQARRRVENLFRRLWHNTDADDRGLARRVLDGRYSWLEEGILDPSIDGPWIAEAAAGPSHHENHRRTVPNAG